MQTALATHPDREKKGFHARFFDSLLKHHLIYNACWEDPALDRVALQLTPADRVLVITSAG